MDCDQAIGITSDQCRLNIRPRCSTILHQDSSVQRLKNGKAMSSRRWRLPLTLETEDRELQTAQVASTFFRQRLYLLDSGGKATTRA